MESKKSKSDSFVKRRELKANSEKWKLIFPTLHHSKKVRIKLEVDINPPQGSETEFKVLDFPVLHKIRGGTLPTLFSGKLHCLLCRPYNKGRDWYDFLWYIREKNEINYSFLKNALFQYGPYEKKDLCVDNIFLKTELEKK